MANRGYLWNGLYAGMVSGLVTAIVTYASIIPFDEAVNEAMRAIEEMGIDTGIPEGVLRAHIKLALLFSGPIILVLMMVIGLLFGLLHSFLAENLGISPLAASLVAGGVFTALLVVPNIALGASHGKILSNAITGATYTLALALLTIARDPRRYREPEPRIS